ncbi:hypothetical protein OPQ81_008221 [Rhizoctonia solani]|nr:hypothetical protein OPQ81_008221 [Rhizoctonia solani]
MYHISKWRPDVPYTPESVVFYEGSQWTAKKWNQNEKPGRASGAWVHNEGACPPPWQSDTAYSRGDVVSYNGHKWIAKEWNYNEVPGGSSGFATVRGRIKAPAKFDMVGQMVYC